MKENHLNILKLLKNLQKQGKKIIILLKKKIIEILP